MTYIISSNITLMVSDMDTAITFYTEVLGFKLKNRYGNHWADIEAPGLVIGLHPAHPYVRYGDSMSLGLKVANLAEAMEQLKAKGVEFIERDDTQVQLASFTDPSGNALYLVQEK
ncbi:MAG TPA: VOC family protein [Saprospiraceae bacterium]|nr:VOC family protein [Saprospiraceae bacterium]